MNEEEHINEWYAKHKKQMLREGIYQDPCADCSGKDCACCSYGMNN